MCTGYDSGYDLVTLLGKIQIKHQSKYTTLTAFRSLSTVTLQETTANNAIVGLHI